MYKATEQDLDPQDPPDTNTHLLEHSSKQQQSLREQWSGQPDPYMVLMILGNACNNKTCSEYFYLYHKIGH